MHDPHTLSSDLLELSRLSWMLTIVRLISSEIALRASHGNAASNWTLGEPHAVVMTPVRRCLYIHATTTVARSCPRHTSHAQNGCVESDGCLQLQHALTSAQESVSVYQYQCVDLSRRVHALAAFTPLRIARKMHQMSKYFQMETLESVNVVPCIGTSSNAEKNVPQVETSFEQRLKKASSPADQTPEACSRLDALRYRDVKATEWLAFQLHCGLSCLCPRRLVASRKQLSTARKSKRCTLQRQAPAYNSILSNGHSDAVPAIAAASPLRALPYRTWHLRLLAEPSPKCARGVKPVSALFPQQSEALFRRWIRQRRHS